MNATLSELDIFSRNPSIVVRRSEGDFIALDPRRGLFFSMNETAELVFRLLDGTRTLGAVLDQVVEVYEIDKSACRPLIFQTIQEFARHEFANKL